MRGSWLVRRGRDAAGGVFCGAGGITSLGLGVALASIGASAGLHGSEPLRAAGAAAASGEREAGPSEPSSTRSAGAAARGRGRTAQSRGGDPGGDLRRGSGRRSCGDRGRLLRAWRPFTEGDAGDVASSRGAGRQGGSGAGGRRGGERPAAGNGSAHWAAAAVLCSGASVAVGADRGRGG